MSSDASIFFSVVAAIIVTFMFQSRRSRKRILITDYRRGVRFRGGVFAGLLEPGSYTYDPQKEQITVVDMRPQPILIERLGFQDALRNEAVVSIGTELLVSDPQRAATALRDQIKDSYIIARDTLRNAVSRQILGGPPESIGTLAETIAKAVNTELDKVGMRVSQIEITELWSGPPKLSVAPGSATIQ